MVNGNLPVDTSHVIHPPKILNRLEKVIEMEKSRGGKGFNPKSSGQRTMSSVKMESRTGVQSHDDDCYDDVPDKPMDATISLFLSAQCRMYSIKGDNSGARERGVRT